MNTQIDWITVYNTLDRAWLKAPIVSGEMDNASYMRWFHVVGNMRFTADENAQFAEAGKRDSGYVDELDYDMDLARDPEWTRK